MPKSQNTCRVQSVEHLLSALEGFGVDNARIEIEGGPEVPIVDGSALGWAIDLHQVYTLSQFELVVVGLLYMAYPNGFQHEMTLLQRLRPYPMRAQPAHSAPFLTPSV